MTTTLYRDGALADGRSDRRQLGVSLLARDGVIAWIRPSDDEGEIPAGTRIIDASGSTIVPGMVDAHSHLTLPGGAHWIQRIGDPPERLVEVAEDNARLLTGAGVRWARDVGSPMASDYAPLMQRLHAIDAAGYHLGALEWQAELWDAYSHHRYGFALGISAFPSMHNAISFLYVLAAWKAGPWLRVLTWTFATMILIGSVHLGWHYIADGLFAWPAMAAICSRDAQAGVVFSMCAPKA